MTLDLTNLDQVWADLSAADRVVLIGHDRDTLTDGEKARVKSIIVDRVAAANKARTATPAA